MTPAAQAVTIPAARPISGFRLHPRLCWPGVITQMDLAPAKVPEGEIVWEVTAGTSGRLVGDRNEWLPAVQAALRKLGMVRLSLMRSESWQPAHRWSAVFGRVRSRLETVFGHLTDRCRVKRVWTRDLWHVRNRLLRMVLMHKPRQGWFTYPGSDTDRWQPPFGP